MFFIPLFDDNPTRKTPFISWLIIGLCICLFFWQIGQSERQSYLTLIEYGVIPKRLLIDGGLYRLDGLFTILSSMFLHGGWMHLIFNMLYMWVFADNIEDAMGPMRFIIFYILCGAGAALSQSVIDPYSTIPMIGASGGLAGLLGAYIMIHSRATVRVLFIILIFIRIISLPAWLVLGVWIASQFVAVPAALDGGGGVAYFAHIGGFITGMVCVPFFIRKDVKLFGAGDSPKGWSATPIGLDELKSEARDRYRKSGKSSVPSFRRKRGPWDS